MSSPSESPDVKESSPSKKVTVGFCLLIGLLISIGWLALNRMSHIEEKVNLLLGHEWVKVKLAREALACSSRIAPKVLLPGKSGEKAENHTLRQK